MLYRMVPLVVAIVLVVGQASPRVPPRHPDASKSSTSDPNAMYTIKIREDRKSDKTEESETKLVPWRQVSRVYRTREGRKETEQQDKKYVFTREIVEMIPPGRSRRS